MGRVLSVRSGVWGGVVGVVWMLTAVSIAQAQTPAGVTIQGRVTSEVGVPLPGVNVYVQGLNLGSQTGIDGRYTFSIAAARLTTQPVTLTARVIGYTAKSVSLTLTAGATLTQDFVLTVNPLRLGEVVVTGAGTSTLRDRLATAINTVDSAVINRAMQPANLVSALAATAPNVEVRTQSGDPGASAAIHIRGTSSLIGTGQPLFVVDGQPIDNSTEAISPNGSPGGAMSGMVALNRAADINPNDVESIDILKGAAATTIYGARAANGVVLITTKRGRAGPTRITLNSMETFDHVDAKIPLQTRYGQGQNQTAPSAGCGVTPANYCPSTSWGPSLPVGTPVYNHLSEIFDRGLTSDNNLSVSGGGDRTLFYFSGGYLHQDGVVIGPNNQYARASGRLKASQQATKTLSLGGNVNFIDGRTRALWKGSSPSGLLLGALRTPPEFNNAVYLDPATGRPRSYNLPNPSATADTMSRLYDNPFFTANVPEGRNELGRVIGNVNADWEPLSWLSVKYTLGADYYSEWRLEGFPFTASIISKTLATGRVFRNDNNYLEIDHNLIATARHEFSSYMNGALTIGQNLNSRRQRELYVQGDHLIAPTPFALQNTLTSTSTEVRGLAHVESYFVQGELNLFEQIFFNAGVRDDGFSTFGPAKRYALYPKASVAWDFIHALGDRVPKDIVSYGKLRFAYGESGKEPPIYSSMFAYTNTFFFGSGFNDALATSQSGQGGLTSSPLVGNPNLVPERSREREFGADLSFFKQRADLSATVYNKQSTDVILAVPVNAAQTGALQQYLNGAAISNKGTELVFNLRPYTSKNAAVELGVQYGRNKGKVLSLAGTSSLGANGNTEGFGGALGAHTVGYAPGITRGFDFVRCGRGIHATIAGVGIGADIDSLCTADGNGSYKSGALVLNSSGLPVADPTERVIADPHPKYTMGYNAVVTLYNRFRLSALIDVRKGGEVLNLTRASLVAIGTHGETLLRGTNDGQFGVNFLTGKYPDVTGPGVGVVALTDTAHWSSWFQGLGGINGATFAQFVEDGSFVKLRELALTYTLETPLLQNRIGVSSLDLRVAGRNLHTWTRYTGLDPEAALQGAQSLTQGLDYFNNPQTQSFVVSISLNR